jgi:ferredoxin
MPRLRVVDSEIDVSLLPDENVLDGLQRCGYTASIGCLRGGCGICKVRVVEGTITYLDTVAETVLTPEERAEGVTLLCRAVPVTDTVFSVGPEFRLRHLSPLLEGLARH